MAARVKIQSVETQKFASLYFVKKRCSGLFKRFFFGMAQVNKVTVVRKNLEWFKIILFTIFTECSYACF